MKRMVRRNKTICGTWTITQSTNVFNTRCIPCKYSQWKMGAACLVFYTTHVIIRMIQWSAAWSKDQRTNPDPQKWWWWWWRCRESSLNMDLSIRDGQIRNTISSLDVFMTLNETEQHMLRFRQYDPTCTMHHSINDLYLFSTSLWFILSLTDKPEIVSLDSWNG